AERPTVADDILVRVQRLRTLELAATGPDSPSGGLRHRGPPVSLVRLRADAERQHLQRAVRRRLAALDRDGARAPPALGGQPLADAATSEAGDHGLDDRRLVDRADPRAHDEAQPARPVVLVLDELVVGGCAAERRRPLDLDELDEVVAEKRPALGRHLLVAPESVEMRREPEPAERAAAV